MLEWVLIRDMSRATHHHCVRSSIQGVLHRLLYADDLMLSDESIEELLVKLKTRKEGHAVGHRENKDYDVCHLSGPAEEIWKGSLRRLSDLRK